MANSNPFIQYYVNQSGGDFAVFRGYKYQRGSGIGTFFSKLFRRVSPLLNTPLAKSLGSVIGKTLFNTGSNIVADSFSGQNWKDSTRNRLNAAGKNILSQSINTIKNQYGLGRKRKRASSSAKTSNKKRRIVVSKTKKRTAPTSKSARFRAALKKNFEKYPLFSHGGI